MGRKRKSVSVHVSSRLRRSYDTNFKLMVINHAEATNNSAAGKKFGVTECNVRGWRQMKDKLRNVNSSQKAFKGPMKGCFYVSEQCVIKYVHEKHKGSLPITQEVIHMKELELSHQMQVAGNTSKVQSQYQMVHLDDEMGWIDFAGMNNCHTDFLENMLKSWSS
jgi:hypothetical protein